MADIASLTASRDLWDTVSNWATGAVLIGVVGETVTGLFEWITNKAWRRRVEKASALVLIVGLAGELLSQGKGSRASSEITAILNKQAGEANEKAAFAQRALEQSRKETALIGQEASRANERTGKLEVEASRQRERAALAELALLELKQRISPRRITQAQRGLLLDALRHSQAKGKVSITCVTGDGDGIAFAAQIKEILVEAGWETPGAGQSIFVGGNPIGFFVAVHSAETAPAHAAALQQAFKAAGIDLPDIANPNLAGEGTVLLMVGNKPQ
jgi:hypothetical protein